MHAHGILLKFVLHLFVECNPMELCKCNKTGKFFQSLLNKQDIQIIGFWISVTLLFCFSDKAYLTFLNVSYYLLKIIINY